MALVNRGSTPFILLGGPVFGSVVSVVAGAGMAYGLLVAAAHRMRGIPRPVMITALFFASFFVVEMLSAIVNRRGMSGFLEFMENTPFLVFALFYAALAGSRKRMLHSILVSAPWAAFAALAFGLFQIWLFDLNRPQGGAGNSAIFGMTTTLVFAITLESIRRQAVPVLLGYLGAAAAVAAMILSNSRAIWPLLVILPLVLMLFGRRERAALPGRKAFIVGLVAIFVLGVFLYPVISKRIAVSLSSIADIEKGDLDNALGRRLAVWRVAVSAVPERPILGFGPDMPRKLIQERVRGLPPKRVKFSHVHNFILNELIRAGTLGLIALISMFVAPLWAISRAERDPVTVSATYLLVSMQIIWLASGLVNIMLDHDILDMLFVAVTAVSLYMAFGHTRRPLETPDRGA